MPYVIYVSVDGLRSGDETQNLQTLIDAGELPNFARLQQQGAWTFDARTDPMHTNTLPNHTTMITGRPVEDASGAPGHRYRYNDDPEDVPTSGVPLPGTNLSTIHTSAGEYVPSVFNVVHDNGLSTALYASKSKFSLYDQSYDGADQTGDPAYESGPLAQDRIGADDGLDKIDRTVIESDVGALVGRLTADAAAEGLAAFTFLHIRSPDSAGHDQGWGSDAYLDAVREADAEIGRLFAMIDADPALAAETYLFVTADHGGGGDEPVTDAQHGSPVSPDNFTIPFFVWGRDVEAGADLYAINPDRRLEPDPELNPSLLVTDSNGTQPPIRNGDGGNLALDLLGLGDIPTSAINADQSLNIFGVATEFGTAADDLLAGTDADEGFNGEDGDDAIAGGAGDDVLKGHSGDDLLEGAAGNDRLYGHDGIDAASYAGAGAGVRVVLGQTLPQTTFGAGRDILLAIENAIGSSYGDALIGDGGANLLAGGGGTDRLFGEGGHDRLEGGDGDDRLIGGDGDDVMAGGLGDDTYFVRDGGDVVSEGQLEGVDTIVAFVDYTLGEAQEYLKLHGEARIGTGNALTNFVTGSFGDDRLFGLAGWDMLRGSNGADLVRGGGDDDFLYGGLGRDRVFGDEGGDRINGEDGADTLHGGAGNDRLYGSAGADLLRGGDGDDALNGGIQRDVLIGGGGADAFVFANGDAGASRFTADVIADFNAADGDSIRLGFVDADRSTDEDDAFRFIGGDAFSGTAGELRLERIGADILVAADTDGDGAGDWFIRLSEVEAIVADDFGF